MEDPWSPVPEGQTLRWRGTVVAHGTHYAVTVWDDGRVELTAPNGEEDVLRRDPDSGAIEYVDYFGAAPVSDRWSDEEWGYLEDAVGELFR